MWNCLSPAVPTSKIFTISILISITGISCFQAYTTYSLIGHRVSPHTEWIQSEWNTDICEPVSYESQAQKVNTYVLDSFHSPDPHFITHSNCVTELAQIPSSFCLSKFRWIQSEDWSPYSYTTLYQIMGH